MNHSLLEICMADLFTDLSDLNGKYDATTVSSVIRIRDMYMYIIQRPSAKDADFVRECCNRHKVSRPTAYSDLSIIKSLLPNLSRSSKEFNMWKFTEMILETYNLAKAKKDVRTMERAVSSFGKYSGIDKEEETKVPFDLFVVQPFIPTEDPSVLGFEPIPNRREYTKKLIEKYSRDLPEITEIEYEEADVKSVIDDPGIEINDDNSPQN